MSFFVGLGIQFAPVPDSWRWGITAVAVVGLVVSIAGLLLAREAPDKAKQNIEVVAPKQSGHIQAAGRDVIHNVYYPEAQTPHQLSKREAVLERAAKLIRKRNEKPRPNPSYSPTLGILVQAGAHRLDTEEDIVWVCDEMVATGNSHPFGMFFGDHSPVIMGEWLQFAKAFYYSGLNLEEASAWSFAVQKWKGKDRWLNRPKPEPSPLEETSREAAEQPKPPKNAGQIAALKQSRENKIKKRVRIEAMVDSPDHPKDEIRARNERFIAELDAEITRLENEQS